MTGPTLIAAVRMDSVQPEPLGYSGQGLTRPGRYRRISDAEIDSTHDH
jgi:hypothetical protein